MMRAGTLKNKIKIYKPIIEQNDFGEQIEDYELIATTKCEFVYHQNNRIVTNNEMYFSKTKTIRVRHYICVDEFCIVELENKRYRISSTIEYNKEFQYKQFDIISVNE